MQDSIIGKRKSEHLRIVSELDVDFSKGTMLENVELMHQAIPEFNPSELDIRTEFFGKILNAPLMITSMTGGVDFAKELNQNLAEISAEAGIAFSVGSQRVLTRHPEMISHFAVRKYIPDGVLLGNIGSLQLLEYSLDTVIDLMERIEADGICIHLNAGQELIQDEKILNFKGTFDQIARLNDRIEGKILVKETGAGLSPETLAKLAATGISCVDVAGSGGTSWTKVEMHRAEDSSLRSLGEVFSDWGIPTAFSIISARKKLSPGSKIVSSGGIRNGLEVAKSIALGANLAGFAQPVLTEFLSGGKEAVKEMIQQVELELKTAMILTGAKNLQALSQIPRIYTGQLRDWLKAYDWLGGE